MKLIWKMAAGLVVLANIVACDKDDVVIDPPIGNPSPAIVNFGEDEFLAENADPTDIVIQISKPAFRDGSVKVKVNQEFLGTFQTAPALVNGTLEIPVSVGARSISFTIIPVDNEFRDGDRPVIFEIDAVPEGFAIGTKKSSTVTIMDEELNALPKSYETVGGGWRAKKTFEYDVAGRIKKVHWETATPGLRTGTDTYYYAENDLVERINRYPDHDEYFYQENGRIVRSEEIKNGIKTSYSEYDYDAAGNVGAQAISYRQPSGEFKLAFIYVYLYYTNGNIYKQLTYIPVENSEEVQLISTRTFDNYYDKFNPFPMLEVIPQVGAQINLPGSYRVEEHGKDLLYSFSYDFREDGLPVKRYTSGASASEVTTYQYY